MTTFVIFQIFGTVGWLISPYVQRGYNHQPGHICVMWFFGVLGPYSPCGGEVLFGFRGIWFPQTETVHANKIAASGGLPVPHQTVGGNSKMQQNKTYQNCWDLWLYIVTARCWSMKSISHHDPNLHDSGRWRPSPIPPQLGVRFKDLSIDEEDRVSGCG